ncbi:MAG: TonB-dependent receptor, partial [Verrucomicrobiaceae bacterium]
MTVLISDYFEYYRLAAYLAWRTKERIGIVMGAPSLIELFEEKYYTQLPGGILESFGRLFKNNLKLYVYPLMNPTSGELTTIDNLPVAVELKKLYGYLADRGSFVALDNFNPDYLSIYSRDVLKKIAAGDQAWKEMVPDGVSDLVVKRRFFGCRGV